MRVDLHTHSYYSKDSCSTFEGIVSAVQRSGLDAIALTDHNELDGAFELQRYAPFPVIAGEEIKTDEGEIIGLFLKERIPPRLSPAETIARIREQEGIVYIPHPFDRVRRSRMNPPALDSIVGDIDLLEVFNARNLLPRFNRLALRYAEQRGLMVAAGSDAHTYGEYGHAYMDVPRFEGAAEFLAVLSHGTWRGRLSSPFVHYRTRYDALAGRRRLRARIQKGEEAVV